MTVSEIKDFVMFQTNNDIDDVGEFVPCLLDYINEGYDRLVYAFTKEHTASDSSTYSTLVQDAESPKLPLWTHLGIANWATWCVYRNGNPSKQNRGFQFRAAAEETAASIRIGTKTNMFVNMPK